MTDFLDLHGRLWLDTSEDYVFASMIGGGRQAAGESFDIESNIHAEAIAENRNWALGSAEGKPPYERAIALERIMQSEHAP